MPENIDNPIAALSARPRGDLLCVNDEDGPVEAQDIGK